MAYLVYYTVLLCLLLQSTTYVMGLSCYQCGYGHAARYSAQDIEAKFYDLHYPFGLSCGTGWPSSKLVQDCGSSSSGSPYTCVTINVPDGLTKSYTTTFRGCLLATTEEQCVRGTLDYLQQNLPQLSKELAFAKQVAGADGDTSSNGNVCFCNSDECNSSPKVNTFNAGIYALCGTMVLILSNFAI